MKKKVLSLILSGVLLVVMAVPVAADPDKEILDKQAEYEDIEKRIAAKQSELYKLDGEIEPLSEEIEKNESESKKLTKEIEKLEDKIDVYEKEIKEKEDILGERLRELYKSGGQTNYLTVLMGATSLTDLLSRVDTTNRILNIDKDSISELVELQKKLNLSIESYEQKKQNINRLNSETRRKIKEIEKKKEEKKKTLDEIEDERAKFDEEYLSKVEEKLIQHYLDIINNSDSDYNDIESAITQLENIKNSQLKSPIVIDQANSYIEKGNSILQEKDAANSAVKVGNNVVDTATKYLGHGYQSGATGPDVFDCSGFVQYVFRLHGIELSRTTFTQINEGYPVTMDELQPGDLVFSYEGNHVGIYIGDGQEIHAANEINGVMISPMYQYYQARRVL